MVKCRSIAIAGMIALAGCAGAAQPGGQWSPMPLTAKQIAAVQEGTRRALKDPDSARFGAIRAAVNAKGIVSVCGLVNARNGFGGYTGMKPFVGVLQADPPAFAAAAFGGTDSETWATMTQCAGYGIRL